MRAHEPPGSSGSAEGQGPARETPLGLSRPETVAGASWPGERFSHEVLAVVLQVRGDSLHVLLWQRGAPPFEGLWALPGGPLGADERLGTSLGRHLAAKVDLTDIAYLEQLETRSDPGRDPRGRVLATAYLALVSADVEPRIPGGHRLAPRPGPAAHRVRPRVDRRVRARPAAGQAVLHQHRLRPGPGDLHDRPAAGHLRRLGRPSGLGHQPAAGPDPPRRHRGRRPPPPGRLTRAAGRPRSTGSRPGPWSSPTPSPRSAPRPLAGSQPGILKRHPFSGVSGCVRPVRRSCRRLPRPGRAARNGPPGPPAHRGTSWWTAASSAEYARTSAACSSGSSGLSGRQPSRTHRSDRSMACTR